MVKKSYPHVENFVDKEVEILEKEANKIELILSCGNHVDNLWVIVKKMLILEEYTNWANAHNWVINKCPQSANGPVSIVIGVLRVIPFSTSYNIY